MTHEPVTVHWVARFDAHIAQSIVQLVNHGLQDGSIGYLYALEPGEAQAFLESLERRVTMGEAHLLLGEAEGLAVMMCVLSLNDLHSCRHRAELSKGIVHPAYRGRRLVQLALRKVVERAELFGIEQLVLDVREGSRAHALWSRYGFVTYGLLEDYARVEQQRYRGHYMVQTVTSLRAHVFKGS